MPKDNRYVDAAKIFAALYEPDKIRCLELVREGNNLTKVCKKTNTTTPTIFRFFEYCVQIGLLDKDGRKYKITPKGADVLDKILPFTNGIIQQHQKDELNEGINYLIKKYGKDEVKKSLKN